MGIRFTIRDMLWLAVVVALILGWWLNLDRVANQRDQARREARDLSYTLDRYRAAYTTQPVSSGAPNLPATSRPAAQPTGNMSDRVR